MPIIKSAIKRMKQTAVRRERNVGIKRDIKTAVKAFMTKPTSEGLSAAHSELDTAEVNVRATPLLSCRVWPAPILCSTMLVRSACRPGPHI